MTSRPDAVDREVIEFEGLSIAFDDRVLRPRAWTAEQSRWAVSVLAGLPAGPVLELCAGAGQIGLAAVQQTRRRLVCVEADPVAAAYAAENAWTAGLDEQVDVRGEWMASALEPGEEFALVIADPPWVRRADTGRFPEDPLSAIDGGVDGLDVARQCLVLIGGHLARPGAALLQLGSPLQVTSLDHEIREAGLVVTEVRHYDAGVVALLDRTPAERPRSSQMSRFAASANRALHDSVSSRADHAERRTSSASGGVTIADRRAREAQRRG